MTQKVSVIKVKQFSQVSVALAYNPSYSGGRDREDQGSKPAQANSVRDLILKNLSQKRGWWRGSR
jgi:hypothetical protein